MQDRGSDATVATKAMQRDAASPECFLILYNVSKKHNIGTIARCATAFNVTAICLVGSRHFNTFGSHGSDAFVNMKHFGTLEECCETLKEKYGCRIVGIEIDDSAVAVHTNPFTGPTAFMVGNEGQGLNEKQMKLCDCFVYIPQYGPGTASLNVAVATSIVLHHYALWANYAERSRHGQKFDVEERPQRMSARGTVPYTEQELDELREARRQKKASLAAVDEKATRDSSVDNA
eukprot:jgi/Picsp_1/2778/NSC_01005-R1_obp33pep like protein